MTPVVSLWNLHDCKTMGAQMSTVRLVNPMNPTSLTEEQAARRQAKAVDFTRNIVKDPALADEIESLTVEEYAQRKGFRLQNPSNDKKEAEEMATDQKLVQKIDELCESNRELAQTIRRSQGTSIDRRASNPSRRLSNPNGDDDGARESLQSASAERRAKRASEHLDQALDAMQEAQEALDEGDSEAAQEILQDVLGEYDSDGDEE